MEIFLFEKCERVLCREPDKEKVTAIYEAQVADTRLTLGSRRRPAAQYFIQFFEFDSSWSQWVDEEFLLKDTAENRAIMNKVNTRSFSGKPAKRTGGAPPAPQPIDDTDLSMTSRSVSISSSPSPAAGGGGTSRSGGGGGGGDPSGGHDSGFSSAGSDTECQQSRNFSLKLPLQLVQFMQHECFLLNRRDRQHSLPQTPSVARILQDYLLWFVQHYSFRKKPATYTMSNGESVELFDPLASISLCKEVLDGLRVYFDMALPTSLLYQSETEAYENSQRSFLLSPLVEQLNCPDDSYEPVTKRSKLEGPARGKKGSKSVWRKNSSSSSRKLTELVKEQLPPPVVKKSMGCSGSISNPEETRAIEEAAAWRALPLDMAQPNDPIPPCLIYGAPFLLRLLAKMPQMLAAQTDLPEKRAKLILRHISLFVHRYLVTKPEYFLGHGSTW